MELSRNEYPALVAYLEPNEASAVINDRLKAINNLNTDIADWLFERRKLEENYILGLRKLSRRQPPDLDASLGVFEIPWRRVVSATDALAQSHETLAQEIETDVERPLKGYATKNTEMQSMSSILQDLTGLVKSLETAQKKAAKVKGKRGKESGATSAVDDAKAQWQSRAPFVFERLQAIDEGRISHLRDVLTQFQTHEVDQVERSRQSAEECLNALLSIDSADEIKSFAEKISGGRTLKTENREHTSPTPGANDLPPPPNIQNDTASEQSNTSHHGRPSMASSDRQREQQRPTGFGGLKRLGTVMGRRKSVAPSGGAAPSPEKKFRSPFGFRKNDSSRNFQQMDEGSTENGIGRIGSRENLSSQGQDSRNSTRNQSISENVQPITTNGATIPEVTPEEEAASPVQASTTGESKPQEAKHEQPQTDAEGYTIRPDTVDEITQLQREAAAGDEAAAANLTIRDKPIEEDESKAKQAMSDMANTLRVQAQQTGLSRGTGTLRGRRDVRNTIFIPNPSPDPGPASQGLSPSVSPGVPPPPVSPAQDPKAVAPTDGHPDEQPMSDNASIQSSHTLHSLSGPISHPELQSPGLNVSIVEKLSVLISGGVVTRSYVVGELAMAYNPRKERKAPSETQLIRLDNFQVLERVAANPQFVAETHSPASPPESERPSTSNSQDKKGVYNVSLASITGPSPNVAFKYQVHLDSSNLSSYCPVIFTPVWNEQEFQAKVIIAYSLNPNFLASQPPTSITVRNLTLSVSLDLNPVDEATKQPREVARATGAAMHPNTGATFRRKASAVVWKIPELVVSAKEDGKFLAQFNTSTSWPRKGKVDAKFDTTTSENSMRLGVSSFLPVSDQAAKSDDLFADESTATSIKSPKEWKELPTERKLSVARYASS